MKLVKESGGVTIAVDNGEGCAREAIRNANVIVTGAVNTVDLPLEPTRLIATLRSWRD
jgi:hypothetical protein